jgi:hypothetical protein
VARAANANLIANGSVVSLGNLTLSGAVMMNDAYSSML